MLIIAFISNYFYVVYINVSFLLLSYSNRFIDKTNQYFFLLLNRTLKPTNYIPYFFFLFSTKMFLHFFVAATLAEIMIIRLIVSFATAKKLVVLYMNKFSFFSTFHIFFQHLQKVFLQVGVFSVFFLYFFLWFKRNFN